MAGDDHVGEIDDHDVMRADPQAKFRELWALLGVGIMVILLRLYARHQAVGFRGWQADDYLMILVTGVYAVESVLAYRIVAVYGGLGNNGISDEDRAGLDPNSVEYSLRVGGSQLQIAGWSVYVLLLWLIKAALCTYFLRLTKRIGSYRRRVVFAFVFVGVTYLIVALSILLGCTPIYKNWQISPDPGLNCQPTVSRINIFVTLTLNIASDLYLISIPIPMLWAANINAWKKCGLIVLFSSGLLVVAAGILRCLMILTYDLSGGQHDRHGSEWAMRESFMAVMTSNLPLIYPLIKQWFTNFVGSFGNGDGRGLPLPDEREGFHHREHISFVSAGSKDQEDQLPTQGIRVELDFKVSSSTKEWEQ